MDKILLALLPFWDPQIPPSGISCLKSFLQQQGFHVKAVDANVEENLDEIYNRYFDSLKTFIIEEKRGNFYKIGYDVLRHQMMAFLNYKNEKDYTELVKSVIYHTFYVEASDRLVLILHQLIHEFYSRLSRYVLDLLAKEKPTVLGISVYGGTLAASLFTFKLAKEKYPHIKTVMGGGVFADLLAPGSPNLERFLYETPYIDKMIVGEGEELFLKLLQGKLAESQRVYSLKDINQEILDLSTVEVPDFSDFELKYYPNLFAYTSRSCPYQCLFCTEIHQWGKYRKKSSSQVVEEMEKLNKKYGLQVFMLGDSLLNPTITGLAREMINAGLSLYWDGYLRVDKQVSETGNSLLWRRGGFYRARLGVESGSQQVLDLMHKQINVNQIKETVSTLAYAGIKTTTYWIVGYPGETEDDFQETLDLVEELGDDIYEADCSPFWYHYTNQGGINQWKGSCVPLYPEKWLDMMLLQTWTLECPPSREEIHRRMQRFVQHCSQLGIPNPYSFHDIYKADERWRELHKNAVPSLVDFKNPDRYIDENKRFKELLRAAPGLPQEPQDNGDFVF